MEKSANKRWKESGTTLSFKEWIIREDSKKQSEESGEFIPFTGTSVDGFNTMITDTLAKAQNNVTIQSGLKTQANDSKVFGLDKGILIFSGLLIAGSIGYYFYAKLKQKK